VLDICLLRRQIFKDDGEKFIFSWDIFFMERPFLLMVGPHRNRYLDASPQKYHFLYNLIMFSALKEHGKLFLRVPTSAGRIPYRICLMAE
jgi:hypothetical protein